MIEIERAKQAVRHNQRYTEKIINERIYSQCVCAEYNRLSPADYDKREALMREHIQVRGDTFMIEQPFYCDFGYNIEIGDHFFSNYNLIILDGASVTFGDHVFIAPNCGFYTAGHPLDAERRNTREEYALPIMVGNHVWIGDGVHVMPSVTIGDNSVIAGGSIVVKDIPANVIAAGNPCRVLREISAADKERYQR